VEDIRRQLDKETRELIRVTNLDALEAGAAAAL
jgi:hypothetical protein